MRQDQYELKGRCWRHRWSGRASVWLPDGGASWSRGWRDGPAAVPAAADRTERVRRPGGGQGGNAPSACGRRTCRSGKGRRPWPQSGTAGRRRRRTNTAPWWPATTGSAPAGGFAAMEESLARWAGRPLGRSCWTMSRRSGGRRGPGREGGALPDPCPAGRTGRRGAAARAAAGAV